MSTATTTSHDTGQHTTWHVGRGIEVSPHVRAACPAALYWTGEGRQIPKIRFRRGSIVHRKKFAAMPTGFLEGDETA